MKHGQFHTSKIVHVAKRCGREMFNGQEYMLYAPACKIITRRNKTYLTDADGKEVTCKRCLDMLAASHTAK